MHILLLYDRCRQCTKQRNVTKQLSYLVSLLEARSMFLIDTNVCDGRPGDYKYKFSDKIEEW